MDAVLIAAGAALIALVWLDVIRTVLLPSSRGPLNHAVYRALWAAARATPRRVRTRMTQFAGPASIATSIALWLGLLWLGFALIYWARIEDVALSTDVEFGRRGVVEALYLSGTALTTLGMGDAAGDTDTLRLLTVLQAASGLGLFTATISYLPAIYTLVSQMRGSALAASDLHSDEPERLRHIAEHGGVTTVEALRRDLVSTRELLLRFPVLFYFHPPAEESPLTLARAAAALTAALRWDVDRERVEHAEWSSALLGASLIRLLDELDRHVGAPADPAGHDDERRAFLARVDAVLGGMAAMHGYDYAPLAG